MSSATLADQLIEVVLAAGAERIYGVAGDSLNPVVDAVRRAGGIEWVHVRNEEAGAFAAASSLRTWIHSIPWARRTASTTGLRLSPATP